MKFRLLFLVFCSLVVRLQAQDTKHTRKEFMLGYIETLHSVILGEDRILNLYLPEGYNDNDTVKYPVIYLLDGSADEDFIHVAGLVQFNTFPWIDRIPKSIVVGIANTNRKRDFTNPAAQEHYKKMIPANGGSARFIAFIEKELQPFIERKYHTKSSKTLIGQSLGGLLATEILFTKPQLFNQYIIISPSLWWNDGAWLKRNPEVLRPDYTTETGIYIGVGKEGSIDGSQNHIMEEDAKLLYEKINNAKSGKIKVYYDYLPQEDHATVTHQAIFNAFRILYPARK